MGAALWLKRRGTFEGSGAGSWLHEMIALGNHEPAMGTALRQATVAIHFGRAADGKCHELPSQCFLLRYPLAYAGK